MSRTVVATWVGALRACCASVGRAQRRARRQPFALWGQLFLLAVPTAISASLLATTDALFRRALALPNAYQVVAISAPFGVDELTMRSADGSPAVGAFETVAGYRLGSMVFGSGGQAADVQVAAVTDGFFGTTQLGPTEGRGLDGSRTSPLSDVVVSEAFARRRGLSVGSVVKLSGRAVAVIGVVHSESAFPLGTEIWCRPELADATFYEGSKYLNSLARLRAGASLEQALSMSLAGRTTGANAVRLLRDVVTEKGSHRLAVVGLLAGALWFMSSVAAVYLSLQRISDRRHELAVRRALGASHARVLLVAMDEFLIVAWGAALLAMTLSAVFAGPMAGLLDLGVPGLKVDLSGRITAVLACHTLLMAALVSLFCSEPRLGERLKDKGRRSIWRRDRMVQAVAVLCLAAVSTALCVFTVTLANDLRAVLAVDPGYRADGVITVGVQPAPGTATRLSVLIERLEQQLRAAPGVVSIGSTSQLPVRDRGGFMVPLMVNGGAHEEEVAAWFRVVSAGYFRTLQRAVVQGREFVATDGTQSKHMAIVSEGVWRRLRGYGSEPRTIRLPLGAGWEQTEVVGVVADSRHDGPEAPVSDEVFVPLGQVEAAKAVVCVRVRKTDGAAIRAVASVVQHASSDAVLSGATGMNEIVRSTTSARKVHFGVAVVFLCVGVSVLGVTIYSLLLSEIRARDRELAIRAALGATKWNLIWALGARVAVVVFVGIAAGVIGVEVVADRFADRLHLTYLPSPTAIGSAVSVVVAAAGAAVAVVFRGPVDWGLGRRLGAE